MLTPRRANCSHLAPLQALKPPMTIARLDRGFVIADNPVAGGRRSLHGSTRADRVQNVRSSEPQVVLRYITLESPRIESVLIVAAAVR